MTNNSSFIKSVQERKRKVYTYGVFDLMHYGHIRLLKKAKALREYLIVGVYTDDVAEGFKRRPILTQEERLQNIKELGIADEVVLLDKFVPDPDVDIVAKAEGAGWSKDETPEFYCKTKLLNYTEGISTSEIIKRIHER